ncbi:MAG: DUF6034 family protein [Clostridia bacterium]
MKRFGIMALVLCLLGSTACAEMVAEQVNAPEHITLESFQTESGLSTFVIDAQVQVPSVKCLNTYEYHTIPVTEEMLRNVADAVGLTEMTIEPFDSISEENKSNTTHSLSERNNLRLSAANHYFDTQSCGSYIEYEDITLAKKEDCAAYACMWLWPCEGETAPDTDYPFADATELALQTVERFAPDMALIQAGIGLSYKQLTDAEIRKLNDPNYKGEKPQTRRYGTYGYLFARVVDGVAVTHGTYPINATPTAEDIDAIGYIIGYYETLAIVVKDGHIASIKYTAPSMAGKVKQENVELLPFEQILELAKPGLLQTGMMNENEYSLSTYGMTMSYPIDRISLSYLRVRAKDNPNGFELIPVWNFYGKQCSEPDPNSWMRPNTLHRDILLSINAMDGTVIGRE